MYTEFYGLREKPFSLTPDPKFLYLNEKAQGGRHADALAHLRYGIENRAGFVMITGEIGTGKTTICRSLLNDLRTNVELALVFNPKMNVIELLRKINAEFGVDQSGQTVLDLTEALNAHLLDAAREGKICVLVIDEAQNLSPEVLEQIRLLSNLETDTEKLLQIFLIGQPELLEKLQLPELRQLNQRITARYHLTPLSAQETLEYIAFRLHVAGSKGNVRFEKEAVRLIHRFSRGTPRVINALCDRALLMGYAKSTRIITKAIVQRAAKEVQGEAAPRRREKRIKGGATAPKWAPALLLGAIIIAGIVFQPELKDLGHWLHTRMEGVQASSAPASPSALRPVSLEAAPDEALPAEPVHEDPSPVVSDNAPPVEEPAAVQEPLNAEEVRKSAAAAVLRAWNMAAVGGYPADDSLDSMEAFAKNNGLSAETLEGSLSQIVTIDLPFFVLLHQGEETIWRAVLERDGDTVRLTRTKDAIEEVPLAELLKQYADKAVVVWRDSSPGQRALFPGRRGREVVRFKKQLRRLSLLAEGNTSDRYDSQTAAAVSKLQANTGLLVDGIAGKQVRMVLASWLNEEDMPSLGGGDIPAPSPEAVAEETQETDVPEASPDDPAVSPKLAQEEETPEEGISDAAASPELAQETEPRKDPQDEAPVSPELAQEENAPEETSDTTAGSPELAQGEEAPDAPASPLVAEGSPDTAEEPPALLPQEAAPPLTAEAAPESNAPSDDSQKPAKKESDGGQKELIEVKPLEDPAVESDANSAQGTAPSAAMPGAFPLVLNN